MRYPRGAVARVEVQWSHQEFAQQVYPPAVELKLTHARRLPKRDETTVSYFGERPTVITTSTINDQSLSLTTWEEELGVVQEVEPDFHLPCDYSVYESHTHRERCEYIQKCMDGTEAMVDALEDTPTAVIPLIKGLYPNEREICYDRFDELGLDYAGYYAAQYFTGGNGIQIERLIADIEQVVEEAPDLELFVIGLLSPRYLERLPDQVVAAAGLNQWRDAIKPQAQSTREMQRVYAELCSNVNEALGVGSVRGGSPATEVEDG